VTHFYEDSTYESQSANVRNRGFVHLQSKKGSLSKKSYFNKVCTKSLTDSKYATSHCDRLRLVSMENRAKGSNQNSPNSINIIFKG
jgi:hypothetical protein